MWCFWLNQSRMGREGDDKDLTHNEYNNLIYRFIFDCVSQYQCVSVFCVGVPFGCHGSSGKI